MPVIQRNNNKFVEAVSVRDFYDSFKEPLEMELVAGESGLDNMIKERSLNRPALAMVGFFKAFAAKRIQLLGAGEMAFIREKSEADRVAIMTEILKRKVPVSYTHLTLPTSYAV